MNAVQRGFVKRLGPALAAIWAVQLFQSQSRAGSLRTVALTGQPAPGTSSEFLAIVPTRVVINDAGHTAFVASLSAGESDQAFFSEALGGLTLIARSGMQAPGSPDGHTFLRFYTPAINNVGHTAFAASVQDFRTSVWSTASGTLKSVTLPDMHAPGAPAGVTFLGVGGNFAFNDAGQTAFTESLKGTGVNVRNQRGVWSEGPGGLTLLARQGTRAPGTPDDVIFISFFALPDLNNRRHSAFYASLEGTGVVEANRHGIWSDRTGSLELVLRTGTQAPGLPVGVNYVQISSGATDLNDSDQIAFLARLAGPGIGVTNSEVIWVEDAGSFRLVARSGSQAPGAPSGVTFGTLRNPVLNNAGQTAFVARLSGSGVDSTNDFSLWREGSHGLEMIARRGSQAPGVPEGMIFNGFFEPTFNSFGQVAFAANLLEIPENGTDGIWATDRAGTLKLIARVGGPLEVGPGDSRIISVLNLAARSGDGDGRPSGLNLRGQIAFRAEFTDGTSGVFVSNLVAVPEPTALALAALAYLIIRHVAVHASRYGAA